jgi:hypothetical protein
MRGVFSAPPDDRVISLVRSPHFGLLLLFKMMLRLVLHI